MRKLTVRDLLATLIVAAVVVPFVGYSVRGSMPFVQDPRGMAGVGIVGSLPAGTVATLGAGFGAGLATGSVMLGMFWALLAGYVVRLMFTPRITVSTRLVLVLVTRAVPGSQAHDQAAVHRRRPGVGRLAPLLVAELRHLPRRRPPPPR